MRSDLTSGGPAADNVGLNLIMIDKKIQVDKKMYLLFGGQLSVVPSRKENQDYESFLVSLGKTVVDRKVPSPKNQKT